jgi:hypothetical protein
MVAGFRRRDGIPDSLGRRRHVEMADAERRERVDEGVITEPSEPAQPASPHPLAPSGLVNAGIGRLTKPKLGTSEARGKA